MSGTRERLGARSKVIPVSSGEEDKGREMLPCLKGYSNPRENFNKGKGPFSKVFN